jgi:ATP-dependent exoDNAse (exonuclease V) beta subunit
MTTIGPPVVPSGPLVRFTPEQTHAIERRQGDMLLDAGAGSGKTTVLVERFARAVVEDHIDVGAILTITFTEKAAAELRDRIRTRLRAVSDDSAALATEGAWISTIHGFCARVLRTHALTAGLDPNFTVLDEHDAAELQDAALAGALAELARSEEGADLIAAYGPRLLGTAITRTYSELRAGGQLHPQLPTSAQAEYARLTGARSAERCRAELFELARAVAHELASAGEPGKQVLAGLAAIDRVPRVLAGGVPWPGELDRIKLPGGTAKALRTEICSEYRATLEELRLLAARDHAITTADTLDTLLRRYGERYTQLKRERSALDFEDLELLAREVLKRKDIGRRYRERFARVMVDEMQDTNRVQLELIDLVAGVDLFMVGDAQQSIYGFRHADVALFEQRGQKLAAIGARASLQTNFRSRAEILIAINAAFGWALGDDFRPLLPSPAEQGAIRTDAEPLVELLIVDKDAVTATDDPDLLAAAGSSTVWRLAEARALAARVAELVAAGLATPGEVVVLMRATTDIQVYDRALADAGLPTYVIGGRGYWEQPQVIQLSCYLRALANPLDHEAWHTTLLSPLCGLSLDGLVLVAAGARDQLQAPDRERLERFESWFLPERGVAARLGVELLLERALDFSDYEIAVVALPNGRRRLANVRKLMRLAREWETANGADLRGFLRLVRTRATGDGVRESEAPVESESLDAVRLMTIHRSKGLEFPVVCVADLGRKHANNGGGLIRIGRDGRRLGLQLRRAGRGDRINALWYDQLGEEQRDSEDAEERRLFYVAMTRAKERLIVSGAATFNDWEEGNRAAPIGWVGSAFVPDIDARAEVATVVAGAVGAQAGSPPFTTDVGVKVTLISRVPSLDAQLGSGPPQSHDPNRDGSLSPPLPPPSQSRSRLSTLSYTSLSAYERCGYRFYVEHVLGVPPPPTPVPARAAARGTEIHAILAELDFRGPNIPLGMPPDVRPLIAQFAASSTFRRLALLGDLRREQHFAFSFQEILITGTFDVLARDPRTGGALVVDYKSDRLGDRSAAQITAENYGVQRTVYALAALRLGVPGVEVFHVFLERPEEPVAAIYTVADLPVLEADLAQRVAGPLAGDFTVTQTPGRRTCFGCPARGGVCSWPLDETER